MKFEKTLPILPRIGRYQITRELGRGTMGIVYEAFDPKLERTVALKTVRLEAGAQDNQEFEKRFQREGKSAGRLNHPSIVTIHDAGEENETAYIAMEFLEGETLRDILDSGARLSIEEIINLAIQMADALDYAHRFGIVHRDIKPGNIVISSQGRLKISDFGIAQLPTGDLTQAGTILGTPKYMSPEQVRGERLDGRSDIFSLGVILYEMVAGKPPFFGDSLTAIMYKILHEKPADPASVSPNCPAGVRQIIARSLAKDKGERYAQASDMAADLRKHLQISPDPMLMAASFSCPASADESQLPAAASATVVAPQTRPPRRTRLWLGTAGALLIPLAGLAIWKTSLQVPGAAPQTTSAARPAPPTSAAMPQVPPGKASAESASSSSPKQATTKNKSSTKPKSFWQRQMDCIKRGICEKPTQPSQAVGP